MFLEQDALLYKGFILVLSHLPILLYSSKRMAGDEEQKLLLKSSRFQCGVTRFQAVARAVILGWPSVSSAADLPRRFQALEWLSDPLHCKDNMTDSCMYEFNIKYLHFCCSNFLLHLELQIFKDRDDKVHSQNSALGLLYSKVTTGREALLYRIIHPSNSLQSQWTPVLTRSLL